MRILLALAALALLALSPVAAAQPEGGFDSGDIEPGASYVKLFKQEYPEGYHYHCHPHPWMKGMVHVGPDEDGEVENHVVRIVEGEDSDAWGYLPTHLFIEAGDTVTWENTGSAVHTVTAVEGMEGHDHGDHDHAHDGTEGSEDSPIGLVALIGLVAALALARRWG